MDQRNSRSALILICFSLLSGGIGYATSVFLARVLGPEGFSHYVVAIAAVATLASLAEFGTGKHALRILPALYSDNQWSLANGYGRFSLLLVLVISISLGLISGLGEWLSDGEFGDYPLGIGMLFLPIVALFGAGIEFAMANSAAIRGTFLSRLFVPITSLLLMILGWKLYDGISPSWAVACYGLATSAGLVCAAILIWRSAPQQFFLTHAKYEIGEWLKSLVALVFLIFLMTWLFKISILILEMLPLESIEVARFAAALETGSLILLLSKSTDKFFQPQVSIIVNGEKWEEGKQIRRNRNILIGGFCAVYLLVVVIFGSSILSMFGSEYTAGYPALCLITVATCTWTLFSIAPAYLRFIGLTSFVMKVTIVSAVALAALTGVLGLYFGATGAATAFCVVLVGMTLTLFVKASTHLYSMAASND